jgi:hypothetical protein
MPEVSAGAVATEWHGAREGLCPVAIQPPARRRFVCKVLVRLQGPRWCKSLRAGGALASLGDGERHDDHR